MSNLIPFSFESREIRFIPNGDSFFVVVKDVLLALEYAESSNPARVIKHVPTEWKGVNPIHTPGGIQELLCLTEQGFYFFVNRSDKPKALPLQMWVAGDVLPQIRKTGSYALPNPQPPANTTALAQQLADLLKDKVLVDYGTLVELANIPFAMRHLIGLVESYAAQLEAQIGKPLINRSGEVGTESEPEPAKKSDTKPKLFEPWLRTPEERRAAGWPWATPEERKAAGY